MLTGRSLQLAVHLGLRPSHIAPHIPASRPHHAEGKGATMRRPSLSLEQHQYRPRSASTIVFRVVWALLGASATSFSPSSKVPAGHSYDAQAQTQSGTVRSQRSFSCRPSPNLRTSSRSQDPPGHEHSLPPHDGQLYFAGGAHGTRPRRRPAQLPPLSRCPRV